MIRIDERQVDALAANETAIVSGREIGRRRALSGLSIGDGGTCLFGSCKGRGATPYACSVDFTDPLVPVARCSCPSRQSTCKHCLGLLYAWVRDPSRFRTAKTLPPALADARAKAAKRTAGRGTRGGARGASGAASTRALQKKRRTQLDALELFETLLEDIVGRGLAAHDEKAAEVLAGHAARLRAAFLPGAERALVRVSEAALRARAANERGGDEIEAGHHRTMDELARARTLARRGRAHLEACLADPALAPDTDGEIATLLGHAWTYDELRAAGRGEGAADLVQLAFLVVDDRAASEHVDTGVWLHLGDGRLFRTETRRPYHAVGRVKAEDSDFELARVAEFVRHPGASPERIRWRGRAYRKLVRAHYRAMNAVAEPDGTDLAALIRSVRDALKSPLAESFPLALVRPARIGPVGDPADARYAIEDAAGVRLELADRADPTSGVPPTTGLLPLVGRRAEGAALLCLFHSAPGTCRIAAQPLALLHDGSLTRLAA